MEPVAPMRIVEFRECRADAAYLRHFTVRGDSDAQSSGMVFMLISHGLSAATLASVLEQSVDCVKLLGLGGDLLWMNANGQCAVEIEDFASVAGQPWRNMWPDAAHDAIAAAYVGAAAGKVVRFRAASTSARGQPQMWDVCVSLVVNAADEPVGFLATSRDVTEAEKQRQALDIAVAEMRHRLRNTYAMIGSLLAGFARGNPDRTQFAAEMRDRLAAMSAAQALFSSDKIPCDVATLIPALLAPFDGPNCAVIIEPVPSLLVSRGQADAMALVLGELAVNSSKHGALTLGGSIRIAVARTPVWHTIIWSETSAGPVLAHTRPDGVGLNLIDRIVRARSGTLDIVWRRDGLTASLGLPVLGAADLQ